MGTPSVADLAKQVTDTQTALNMVWILVAAFMVMFMQAGFALVETGLTRAKSMAHTMGMNFLVYAIGILGFWSIGFGLQMGGVGELSSLGGEATLNGEYVVDVGGKEWGLFGTEGFFLTAQHFTPAVAALFLFQMMFMDTATTIPTGAMAERWKFASFVAFSLLMSTLVYPIYANWVWGGGWLSALGTNYGLGNGHVDFAGSSVVHMTGGVAALVGAKLLGPRLGKYDYLGRPRAIQGHNMSMTVVGTFILAFGWFGFNAGSTLAATDSRIAIVAVNTMLASAAGACGATAYVWLKFGKPDVSWMCNGLLAGAVAITAPCAFVSAPAAILIGAVAGNLVVMAALFVESTLKVDDPVGAIAVHGVNGTFGALAVGIFANGSYGAGLNGVAEPVRGIIYGNPGQLWAQCIGVLANVVYVGVTSAVALVVIGKAIGNRVAEEDEVAGLDLPEMGVEGYGPDYPLNPIGHVPAD